MKIVSSYLAIFGLILLISACDKKEERQVTPQGVEYINHTNAGGRVPQIGDFVTYDLEFRVEGRDTVYFSTYKQDREFTIQVTPSGVYGDPADLLLSMGQGDSSTFYLVGDSLPAQEKPSFLKDGEILVIDMKVQRVETEGENTARKQEEQAAAFKPELDAIKAYLADKGITEYQQHPSGLIYTVENPGSGAFPKIGNQVKIHYNGYLLDGTKFDSSLDRGEPLQTTIGIGQVIKGWDIGIPLFQEGGKGTLYIPSPLAYGEKGYPPNIPPNATLRFEIELLDVIDPAIAGNEQKEKDKIAIENYIKKNGLQAKQSGGLYYVVEDPGQDPKPKPGQQVTVHYRGTLLNGKQFDSSYDRGEPYTFPLGQGMVIRGWDVGIPLFGKGGKGKLIIPSAMAYGDQDRPTIPANSPLVFDIEVVDYK